MEDITSPAFVVRGGEGAAGTAVVAAAGYEAWPESTAHVSVLTAAGHRGRGLARRTASAAVAHALEAGLMPQWRARTVESRAVARALGFRELGVQLSVRLDELQGRAGPSGAGGSPQQPTFTREFTGTPRPLSERP
ncbi:GNAT family N-acetyltransferase [Streptomyces sp. Root1304]|uniref:GNAT family N-acetyltransferase n=2 Tax=unclassified Streptomyces TaxID=2593676 RepID=UPI003221DB50